MTYPILTELRQTDETTLRFFIIAGRMYGRAATLIRTFRFILPSGVTAFGASRSRFRVRMRVLRRHLFADSWSIILMAWNRLTCVGKPYRSKISSCAGVACIARRFLADVIENVVPPNSKARGAKPRPGKAYGPTTTDFVDLSNEKNSSRRSVPT